MPGDYLKVTLDEGTVGSKLPVRGLCRRMSCTVRRRILEVTEGRQESQFRSEESYHSRRRSYTRVRYKMRI